MPSSPFRPLLTSWFARRARAEAAVRVHERAIEPALGDWLFVEDATSRWLRTTQGAELG